MTNSLNLIVITGSALLDSINPCAIAILIFLVTFLIETNQPKKKMLLLGLIFIFFVYLTYFFAGLGILQFAYKLKITRYIYFGSGILVIIAGLINIQEFFFGKKFISLSISNSKKKILKKYIQSASIIGSIILGILVSLFELPCTGGIYFAILGLIATKASSLKGILLLIYYNLIFILPLIAIVIFSYFSFSIAKLESFRKKNSRIFRFFSGILMICLGLLIILN